MKTFWLSTFIALLFAQVSVAQETLTATNMDPDWESINAWAIYVGHTNLDYDIENGGAAQEFIASVSGTLSTIEASVDKSQGGAPLVITIYESNNGLPGASLGAVSIPDSEIGVWGDLPNPPVQPFDISSANINVDSGQKYIVAFTSPLAGAIRYRAILTANNANSFGYRALRSNDGGLTWEPSSVSPEIGMRVYVGGSVPPPPPPADIVTAVNFSQEWMSNFGQAIYVGDDYEPLGIENEGAAQEFSASLSGQLSTLEVSLDKFSGGAPLVITFYRANNGFPGESLGSVSIPETEVQSWNDLANPPIQSFDVSATNVYVEKGQNYIVAFTTPTGGAVRYRAALTAPNNYSFGYGPLSSKDGGATWDFLISSAEIGIRLHVYDSVLPPPVEYEAAIDIQPDDSGNQIQLGKKKPKPVEVVLFGDGRFGVSDVLVRTLGLGDPTIEGGVPTAPVDSIIVDVDGDGIDDLSLVFDLAEMELNGSIDTFSIGLMLDGMLSTGDFVTAADFVSVSQPGGGGGKGGGKGGGNGGGKGKKDR